MFNKYYTYENISLYDPSVWTDHYSPVRYLFHRIEEINHNDFRFKAGEGPYSGKQGDYNAKTLSFFYPEYINSWKEKGMIFHSTEMGGICWTAMVPQDVYERKNRDPQVLIVLNDADFSDPNWSIHILTKYDDYTRLACKDGFVVLYINMTDVSINDTPFGVMQEFSVIYNILMNKVYLDLSHLIKTGSKISEIEGFSYTGEDGAVINDPDSCIFSFHGIPVLDISHRWQNHVGGGLDVNPQWIQNPRFNKEKFIHSQQGKALAEELRIEYDNTYWDDPSFLNYWENKGVEVASHDLNDYQWISCATKDHICPDKKIPAVLIFQEVTYQDRHQAVTAISSYKNYMELAASGELIALFFALESPTDNELFMKIAEEAAKIYPIDMTRLYVTGHSHNGYFAELFAHRFRDRIAAVAPLGNHPGIPEPEWSTSPFPVSDEMVEDWKGHDLPTVLITTAGESRNGNLHCRQDDDLFSSAARAYMRRQTAQNCEVKSVNDIIAVRNDPNPVRAEIEYPVDDLWIEYHDGSAVYIGELVNKEGKRHFRLAFLTNQSHFLSPQMSTLGWEFMRRFAKDPETGRTVELY